MLDKPLFFCYNDSLGLRIPLKKTMVREPVMKKIGLAILIILCCCYVQAQNLYVPTEHTSIQSAIDAAGNGDVIIVDPNTYYENINFLGKAITVRSIDPNDPDVVAATIIDGSLYDDPNNASVVTFNSGEGNDSILAGLTITGGAGTWLVIAWEFHEPYWNLCGGGIVCYNMSEPTITKNVITNNSAGEGGGIYVYGDPVYIPNPSDPPIHLTPLITNNTFTNNNAIKDHGLGPPDNTYTFAEHGDGGAVVCFQGVDPVISGNLMQSNHADYYGGAIHLRQWSDGRISNNQILGNDSRLGAGIHVTYISSPLINSNLIKLNTCTGGGGGIYVYYYSDPVIEYNMITENNDWQCAGIGIYWSSDPVIRNNFITDNNGPGIYCKSSSAVAIINNTIVNNSKNINKGGIRLGANSGAVIENNIIALTQGGYGISDNPSITPIIRYNNVWGNELGDYGPFIGDKSGTNGNISIDPNFASDENYHLLPISPCINAGDPNLIVSEEQTDIDGEERISYSIVDIGADEIVLNEADFNNDGIVNYLDFAILYTEWLTGGPLLKADLSGNGFVDIDDCAMLAEQWLWIGQWYE